MLDLRWITIKGHGIEDVFASYNFSEGTFEVEGFTGNEGVYEVSGDLPKEFPNPATVNFSVINSFGRFSLLPTVKKFQDQPPAGI